MYVRPKITVVSFFFHFLHLYLTEKLKGHDSVVSHVVVLIVLTNAVWPRVFVLCLLNTVEGVEVLLDRIPGGAPHLVDEVGDSNEKDEEKTGEGGKSNYHIQKVVILLALKYFC